MDLASTYTVFFNTNAPDDHDNSLHLRTNNGGEYNENCLPIYWENLSVHAIIKKDRWLRSSITTRKLLLNKVEGYIPPCSLVAIMGPSGAGKSTLMAALANKLPAQMDFEGSAKIGSLSVRNFENHNFGYMYQQDLFCGVLTVKEHLYFMAKLKLDRRTTDKNLKARVSAVIEELGLGQCANTRIGAGGENGKIMLSGGERKIVSFATELLTDPSFLFCDEPTTGLDSYSAQKVIKIMQRLVSDEGKTVVCIIHQPSTELLNVFNQLILVADGRIAYSGPPNKAISFFESVGYRCPDNYNSADFIMKTLSDSNKSVNSICDEFAASKHAEIVKNAISNEIYYDISSLSAFRNHLSPFWPVKLYHLTGRYLLEKVRNPTIDIHRFLQKVAIAIMVGLCYLGTVQQTQVGIQSVQGIFFMLITENFFTPMYSVMNQLPTQLPLFRREYTSGLYDASTFYIANILSFIPTLIIEPTVYTTIVYCMAGMQTDLYGYFLTVIITILVMAVSTSCGPSVPWFLHWVVKISWFELGFEALTILHWQNVTYIACSEDPDVPCLIDGSEVLDKYEFKVINFIPHIYSMVWLYIGFHLISFVCFVTRAHLNKLS
ncbi:hypothetical protein AGLY_013032 [Aphis glycines]|uniref:ABC transporter domain-containing protein n=1 Tax=Aphis glycines TaxID=307491 RepID=A0A6G0T7J6_APHGL|nr:hypothetical protein AGLY_013032 [Aphis glycines]